jgi:excisionase family DNA binding protein
VSATMSEKLLEAEDVAGMLGMTPGWVYREVRGGRLPHVKLGRYVRFRRSTIEKWLEDREAESVTSPATTKRPGAR